MFAEIMEMSSTIRRFCTAGIIGTTVSVALTDATKFIPPHFDKSTSVSTMVGWSGYLLMKWAEIAFGKNCE